MCNFQKSMIELDPSSPSSLSVHVILPSRRETVGQRRRRWADVVQNVKQMFRVVGTLWRM